MTTQFTALASLQTVETRYEGPLSEAFTVRPAPPEDASSLQVAIVNQNFAETFWPGEDAICRCVIRSSDAAHPLTVIGIAAKGAARVNPIVTLGE